jgi:hypothetical protein
MRGAYNWQDIVLRALILLSGVVAAALFVVNGEGQVLPALAIGGILGVCIIGYNERQES